MSKDQSYGFAIFIISIIVAIVYLVGFFAHYIGLPAEWEKWAVGIPVLLFVLLVLVISGWIGWTMLTTPPPAPLEPEPTPAAQTNPATTVSSRTSTRTRRRRK
jgi:hypothetical protein